MKPDIVRWYNLSLIDGYVGVICRCGRTLHIKNIPSKARQNIAVGCPCGAVINTIYTKD